MRQHNSAATPSLGIPLAGTNEGMLNTEELRCGGIAAATSSRGILLADPTNVLRRHYSSVTPRHASRWYACREFRGNI